MFFCSFNDLPSPTVPCPSLKDGVQEDLGVWRCIHLAVLLLLVSFVGKKEGREGERGGTEEGNKGKEGRETSPEK